MIQPLPLQFDLIWIVFTVKYNLNHYTRKIQVLYPSQSHIRNSSRPYYRPNHYQKCSHSLASSSLRSWPLRPPSFHHTLWNLLSQLLTSPARWGHPYRWCRTPRKRWGNPLSAQLYPRFLTKWKSPRHFFNAPLPAPEWTRDALWLYPMNLKLWKLRRSLKFTNLSAKTLSRWSLRATPMVVSISWIALASHPLSKASFPNPSSPDRQRYPAFLPVASSTTGTPQSICETHNTTRPPKTTITAMTPISLEFYGIQFYICTNTHITLKGSYLNWQHTSCFSGLFSFQIQYIAHDTLIQWNYIPLLHLRTLYIERRSHIAWTLQPFTHRALSFMFLL